MIGKAVIFLMSCIALYGVLKSNYVTLNILTIFIFFQNIILVLISRNIDVMMFNIIVIIKELYIFLVILWSFIRKRQRKRSIDRIERICYLSLILLGGLFFLHSSGELLGSLVSLRQLYIPFIFYIFGKSIDVSKVDMQKSIRFFIKMSVFGVLFGFVELSLDDSFWRLIGIQAYMTLKGFDMFLYDIVPGAFYSYDFMPIIDRIRRMASVFVDPVICGQILGFAVVIAVFYKDLTFVKSKRLIYIALLGVGLILTIAKGGIVIAAISILMLMRKLWHKKYFSTLCIIIALILGIQYIGFALSNDLSASSHINGFSGGINILKNNLFGIGIGGYGNLAAALSAGDAEASESFIGTALGQIGIFTIIYVLFYYAFFTKLKKAAGYDSLCEILFWLNIGLLVTSFVNNTAISFTNCYIYYILSAVNLKIISERSYISRNRQINNASI